MRCQQSARLGLLMLGLAFNALAQNTTEEDLSLSYGDEEFISIATGQKQLVSKAPAVATVITAEEIEKIGATDLDEVLQTVPGLHVARDEFYNPIYTIRGIYSKFNPQVLVLVNGISISNLYLGNRGLIRAGMPVESISRIEIIRGPGSAIYGADAFSGVINIVTKTPEEYKGTQGGFRTGEFDTHSVWLNHGDNFYGFDTWFSMEYNTTDGYDRIIESDLQTVLDEIDQTDASLAPGPVTLSRDSWDMRIDVSKGKWRLRAGWQLRENIGVGAGVGEAVDPRGRFSGERRNMDISYHNDKLSEDWILEAQVSYFYTTQEVEENLILFPPGSKLGTGPSSSAYSNGVIGNPEVFEDHWRFDISTFFDGYNDHQIRIGSGFHSADIYKVRESKNFGLDPNGNPIIPGSPLVRVDDTPFIFLPEDNRRSNYFFIQDIWNFRPDWELTTGVRYDDYSDFGDTVNPRLALVWSAKYNLTAKVLYGTAFRAPSFVDTRNQNNPVALGNPELGPEEIDTLEVAFDIKPTYKSRIGINFFAYEWDKIIDFVPDPAPATTKTAQNQGRQTGEGVELEFDWRPNSAVFITGNYSYQRSTDERTNSPAAKSPEQQSYFRVEWESSDKLQVISQVNWVADRARTPSDIRPKVDDYVLVDMSFAYKFADPAWKLKFMVKNAFDEDAREPSSPSIRFDHPLAGRTYFAELRFDI